MRWLFVGLAASLLILYSPYLLYILRGRAGEFESNLQQEVLASINYFLSNPWRVLMPVLVVALVIEAAYFASAWMVFDRWAFRGLTLGFAFFEMLHLGRTIWYLPRVVAGRIELDILISWGMERTSALMFSIHAILGLLLLLWP
jgi:hypothetical protein